MGLEGVGQRFQGKHKTVTGKTVYGQPLSIPDTSRVSNFLSPRRYLRTQPNTNLVLGDVVILNGLQFIVGEHGDGFYVTPIYKHFKLFEVDESADLLKKVVTVDPVTSLSKVTVSSNQGKVYLSIQPNRYLEDGSKFSLETHVAVCNSTNVEVDDQIGDYIVSKVDHILGISVLELKRP